MSSNTGRRAAPQHRFRQRQILRQPIDGLVADLALIEHGAESLALSRDGGQAQLSLDARRFTGRLGGRIAFLDRRKPQAIVGDHALGDG